MMNKELMDNVMKMKALDERIKKGEDFLKGLRHEYDQLRLHDIPNAMSELDMRSIKGEWGRVTLTGDLTIQTPDKVKLHEWLETSGFGDLIVPTVNHQTLKSFVKEQQAAGIDLPEELIVVNPFSRAVFYKS